MELFLKDKEIAPEVPAKKLKGLISLKCDVLDFSMGEIIIPEPEEKAMVKAKIITSTKGIF